MAEHREEQIVKAVVAALTGLATTGAHVFRGRAHALPKSVTRALCIYPGADTPENLDTQPWQFVDSELTVTVEARVKDAAAQVDSVIAQIRQEVTVALHATPGLGLDFVIDVIEGEAQEPEFDDGGERPIASRRLLWTVRYRRSIEDPSA